LRGDRGRLDRLKQRALALGARLLAGRRKPVQRRPHRAQVRDPAIELRDLLARQLARRVAAVGAARRQGEQCLRVAQPEPELLRAMKRTVRTASGPYTR
jgi:hypothetical protein